MVLLDKIGRDLGGRRHDKLSVRIATIDWHLRLAEEVLRGVYISFAKWHICDRNSTSKVLHLRLVGKHVVLLPLVTYQIELTGGMASTFLAGI